MESRKHQARAAGVLYLLIMTAPLRLIYIPKTLFVSGNASATAENIASHQLLFSLGIVGDLFSATMWVFLAVALYRLFQGVDQKLAALMVILGPLISTPIYFVNTLNDAAALMFARGADFLSVFDKPQRDAMVLLFLRLHQHGVRVNEIFWGLWLVPFGLLVFRSKFMPRFLGVWLILDGGSYLIVSLTGLLASRYEAIVFAASVPFMLGELAIVLWLLTVGAKEPASASPVS